MAELYPTTLLSDEPSEKDVLGFARFLAALERLVFDPKDIQTPLTVGIFGRWGSGKSSLLKQIKAALEARKDRFLTVEFSPWAYQHEPNLLVPLLMTLGQVEPAVLDGEEEAKLFRVLVRWGLYTFLPFTRTIQEVGEKEEEIEEKVHGKLSETDLTKVRKRTQDFVDRVRNGKTLVILIDDLDRCHPPGRIVELLEQIKVFLTVQGCIFILACDQEVVAQAIDAQFPGQGVPYLEKFIQIPIYLPRCQSPQILSLVPELVPPEQDLKALPPADQALRNEWLQYLEHIAAVLENSPRRFKRFYNAFVIAKAILLEDEQAEHVDDYLLAKWVLIRKTSPALAREPRKMLDLEAQLPTQGRLTLEAIQREFGLDRRVLIFLQGDAGRRFETIQKLSLYTRLTGRDLDITREDIEEKVALGQGAPMDLSGLDLSKTYLRNADFAGRRLVETNFRGADLDGATFDGADVQEADFTGVRFNRISLKGVLNLGTIEADDATRERIENEGRRQQAEKARSRKPRRQ